MKAVAELPAGLLDGRLAASHAPEDTATASRIAHVAQLADRGDHGAAAREAAVLIEAGVHDIRVVGFYLFGLFMQRGIVQLPAMLARATALISDDLAVLRPSRRKLQVVNSATAWLFEHVAAQLAFHAKQRGAMWDAWCGEPDAGLPEAIATGCSKLATALEAVIDAPLAAVPLARVRRWTLEELRRGIARREATERAAVAAAAVAVVAVEPAATTASELADPHAGDDAGDGDPDAFASDDDGDGYGGDDDTHASDGDDDNPWPAGDDDDADDDAHARPPRATPAPAFAPPRTGDEPVAIGSPALAVLQAKLAGFQALVARGELAKAAIVARDVRAALASFDPIAYFPSMFAAYFKTLHQIVDDLTPYLEATDQPSWHALESFYRADLRGFFED